MAKKNKNRNPIATVLVAIGIIALIGALGWYVHNLIDDLNAERASYEVAERLIDIIQKERGISGADAAETDENGAVMTESGEVVIPSGDDEPVQNIDPELLEMKTKDIDGVLYIGVIEIPSASLSLPVAYDWDYEKLALSPCRYSGSYYVDDMVICAHDYGSHFRAIRSLGIGETVLFTSVNGDTVKYIVSNIETVQPTAIGEMINNSTNSSSDNSWDLTLFTCNVGGVTRCAVRCVRAK